MRPKALPSLEFLRARLEYDPATGIFRWRKRPLDHFANARMRNIWNTRYAGQIAGSVQHGYIKINFERHFFYAHRLAWLLVHSEDTASQIDHIDGDRLNNRISNLRVASNAENQANARLPKNNTTGVKGVNMMRDKFRAEITVNYRSINLGHYATLEEAATARREAAERLHGEFARHK